MQYQLLRHTRISTGCFGEQKGEQELPHCGAELSDGPCLLRARHKVLIKDRFRRLPPLQDRENEDDEEVKIQ